MQVAMVGLLVQEIQPVAVVAGVEVEVEVEGLERALVMPHSEVHWLKSIAE